MHSVSIRGKGHHGGFCNREKWMRTGMFDDAASGRARSATLACAIMAPWGQALRQHLRVSQAVSRSQRRVGPKAKMRRYSGHLGGLEHNSMRDSQARGLHRQTQDAACKRPMWRDCMVAKPSRMSNELADVHTWSGESVALEAPPTAWFRHAASCASSCGHRHRCRPRSPWARVLLWRGPPRRGPLLRWTPVRGPEAGRQAPG